MPDKPLFQELSAITDAGGFDGFVREVHAETKRILQAEVERSGMPADDDDLRQLCYRVTGEAVTRRLASDLSRLVNQRANEIERHNLDWDEPDQVIIEIKRLPIQVTQAVLKSIFGLQQDKT